MRQRDISAVHNRALGFGDMSFCLSIFISTMSIYTLL